MQKELVSIIVPIFKVEQYLVQCIESIINQTYKNLEIILVDDGSPDNCGKICDEYAKKDTRIKVIHKENGGLSSARNAGLEIASGEYISFIDSDDYISENFVEVLYNLCIVNNAEIAECNFIKFVDEIKKNKNDVTVKKFTPIEMQERIYSEDCVRTVVVWNKLYQKSVYKNFRFPNGKINEDEFTTYKVFDSTEKNIVVTNEPLYYYRYNESSIMGRKFNEKRFDVLDAYKERINYYYNKQYEGLFEKTVYEYQMLLKRFYLLTLENIENPKEHLKKIKMELRENYEKYKKIKDILLVSKIKMFFLKKFPYIICSLILIKNKRKDKK